MFNNLILFSNFCFVILLFLIGAFIEMINNDMYKRTNIPDNTLTIILIFNTSFLVKENARPA